MKRSVERALTTYADSLPRPDDLFAGQRSGFTPSAEPRPAPAR